MWEMTCKEYDAQRNRQVIRRTLFANRGRRKIDHNPMTWKMQARVFHCRLYALATLLHRRIWQANDRHTGQAVGVIHLHFDNNAFQPDDSTGKYSRKHAGSLDEAD